MKYTEKTVDVLFVGGGPSTLGVIWNAIRNSKLGDLLTENGIAIVEK